MAAIWFQGTYVGCEHITGKKKDGSSYDFYNFSFKKSLDAKVPSLGSPHEVLSGSAQDFPELVKKDAIGKEVKYIKQKNYLFMFQFV